MSSEEPVPLVPIVPGDPSTPLDGDSWYNSSTGKFRGQEGGVIKDFIGTGGSGGGTNPGGAAYAIVTDITVSPPNVNAPVIYPPLGLLVADLSVPDGAVNYLPIGGGTLTGGLTIQPTSGQAGLGIIAPNGQQAVITLSNTGVRTWYVFDNPGGTFGITDGTQNLVRLTIDSAGTVAISQAATIGGALNVTGGLTAGSNLTCSGNVSTNQINGTIIIASNYVQVSKSGGAAWFYSNVVSTRAYNFGTSTDGNFYIQDTTAGTTRFYITTAGACIATGNLTCSGNFNTNAITGTNITASGSFSATGGNGVYYMSPTSHHQWYIAGMNNDQLYIADNTAGAIRVAIDANGNVTMNQSATVGVNLTVNGTVNTGGAITCNGNQVTIAGSGAILLIQANSVRAWYLQASNNSSFYFVDDSSSLITASIAGGIGQWSFYYPMNCTYIACSSSNGIGYAQQVGTYHSFTSSGTTITFYRNGTACGSWAFNSPSDERFKRNIGPLEGNPLGELCQVKLISFDEVYMRDPKWQSIHAACGFSAQQLLEAIPEAVNRSEYFHNSDNDPMPSPIADGVMLSLDAMAILARCVGAIQQLSARIKELESGATGR